MKVGWPIARSRNLSFFECMHWVNPFCWLARPTALVILYHMVRIVPQRNGPLWYITRPTTRKLPHTLVTLHCTLIYTYCTSQGRGFNTGVMLMDLAGLRTINWYHTWKSIALRVLKVKQSTPLADQVLHIAGRVW